MALCGARIVAVRLYGIGRLRRQHSANIRQNRYDSTR
jgi:hypothetical protein